MSLDRRLEQAGFLGLWLFAAVALLSISLQNVAFAGMAAWLAWRLRTGQGPPPVPASLRWFLPFLAWALLASWMGENRAHSLDTWKRWLLVFVAVYAAGALGRERDLRSVLGALLLFSGLWCLAASLGALSGPVRALAEGRGWAEVLRHWASAGEWRAASGSGGYMVLGTSSMLVLCLGAGLWLEDARWRRPLVGLALACTGLALLLTQTRSAWLGASAGLGGLLALRRPRWALAAAALGLLAAAWPGSPVRERLAQGLDMGQASTRERVFMQRAALDLVTRHPWLGVGDSLAGWTDARGRRHQGAYPRVQAAHAPAWGFPPEREQGHLHNNLSQVAVMYGLPGLLLLLLWAGRLWLEAWRARLSPDPLARGLAWGLLAAWLGWWVNGSLEYTFGSFQSSFTLWALWGLGLAGFGTGKA